MNILLIDPFPEDMRIKLQALGHPLAYHPDASQAEVYRLVADSEILIMNSKVNADAALLAAGPRLRVICRAGVGMDHFDLPLLESRGILAINTPGANAIPVGEQALGMLLCMLHHIARANAQVRQYKWLREENRGTELHGKTVGIIGLGNTGSALARNLSGMGCRILAYDKYKTGDFPSHVHRSSLEEIHETADILSFHVPLTEETLGWGSAAFFARFRKPIYLLNLSRGPVVPMAGLLAALEHGQVIAAGLDVLENEKLHTLSEQQRAQMDALIADGRVIFTPHIGGWSHESLVRINDGIVDQVARFLQNKSS